MLDYRAYASMLRHKKCHATISHRQTMIKLTTFNLKICKVIIEPMQLVSEYKQSP